VRSTHWRKKSLFKKRKESEGAGCGVRWRDRWLKGAILISLVIGVDPHRLNPEKSVQSKHT